MARARVKECIEIFEKLRSVFKITNLGCLTNDILDQFEPVLKQQNVLESSIRVKSEEYSSLLEVKSEKLKELQKVKLKMASKYSMKYLIIS